MQTFDEIAADYADLDPEDRYRLLIDLGDALEPMDDALKNATTQVRGCSAAVWLYPQRLEDGRLHFLADSNAAITKGLVALVLAAVQDQHPQAIVEMDIAARLAPFDLSRQLSSNRTQGLPNMIGLIQENAARFAAYDADPAHSGS